MASGDRRNTDQDDTEPSVSLSSHPKKDRANTAKAGFSKKMNKAEQSERFKETARKLEADESGEAFERALDSVIPPKPPN